jgi:PiT family inorganic phosphate transporter
VAEGVHWPQLWKVLEALALSPLLGFVLAGGLYLLCRRSLHDRHLYQPVEGDEPPIWWMRGILILTCSGVSFAHGTNDGQKSIGLIMLTIIGLFPATYALNPTAHLSLQDLSSLMHRAQPLIARYGDDEKQGALAAIGSMERRVKESQRTTQSDQAAQPAAATPSGTGPPTIRRANFAGGSTSPIAKERSTVRGDVYQVISQLKHAEDSSSISATDKKEVKALGKTIGAAVEYAPTWVRVLSALCLGVGTMIGYKRIVKTLGERLGNVHLTPAQGASAEVVSALLIGTAGLTGLPVSTTHIVTSGIGGTMVTAGAGLRYRMISRIVIAWLFTLPATILIAGGLYYLLTSPRL